MLKTKAHRYTDDFLAEYKDKEVPWGPLGWVVYKRTYARWIEEENRTENWWETCRRVLEGNYNICPDDPTITVEDMQDAYDHMFHMRWLPAGRGLWISGTETAAKVGASLVNCWNINVTPMPYFSDGPVRASTPFTFVMDKLMVGGGCGYSVSRENVDAFDTIKSVVDLVVVCDPLHANLAELDAEHIPPRDRNHLYIRVADSRRGWTDALRVLIDSHFKRGDYTRTLILDVSDVRPSGTRIKGFGGTSSGPGPLVKMLRSINDILNVAYGRKITTVEAADMVGYIAKCVVSGNVRRSATLGLGDADDTEFGTMKMDAAKLKEVRWTANISLSVSDTFAGYEGIVDAIATNGEPGIINLGRFRNYGRFIDGYQEGIDPDVDGTNPCGEIGLSGEGECCNLVEIFPYFCYQDGVDPLEVIPHAFKYAKRVTMADYSDWEMVERVVKKNMRIGTSISGWEDLKMYFKSLGYSDEYRREWLDQMYKRVIDVDVEYSEALGINVSNKRTTMKPSGSISLLRGASPGRHAHYFEYGIRRVRLSEQDSAMISVLLSYGFHVEPDEYSPNTYVVEFPVKAPTAGLPGFKSADEYTLEEQMQDQMELQTYWADNSVSSTLTFKPDEVDLIPDLLRTYQFKSTSLLPYSGHGYAQAPYEPLTKEEYEGRLSKISGWPTDADLLAEFQYMELVDAEECEGGACPVK